MSFAALAWAAKYHAKKAADKLVLLAYADRHNEETGCAYPSLAWLCEFSSLNRKTVIEAVSRLEEAGILSDTGDRQGSTRQVKVYRVNMETVPKAEPSLKRNSTEKSPKQSRKRDPEPIRTLVQDASHPSRRARPGKTRLPAEWEPPPIAELPPRARACAEQWTPESYATHGEAFGSYWRGAGRMMTNWLATWANRVVALHSQVMRDQKFGNAPTGPAVVSDLSKWTPERRAAYARRLEEKAA